MRETGLLGIATSFFFVPKKNIFRLLVCGKLRLPRHFSSSLRKIPRNDGHPFAEGIASSSFVVLAMTGGLGYWGFCFGGAAAKSFNHTSFRSPSLRGRYDRSNLYELKFIIDKQ
jgi:hypothetical protein